MERTAHGEHHTPVLRGLEGWVIYHAQRRELPGRAGREQQDSPNRVASITRSGIEPGGCGHALRQEPGHVGRGNGPGCRAHHQPTSVLGPQINGYRRRNCESEFPIQCVILGPHVKLFMMSS